MLIQKIKVLAQNTAKKALDYINLKSNVARLNFYKLKHKMLDYAYKLKNDKYLPVKFGTIAMLVFFKKIRIIIFLMFVVYLLTFL